MPEVATHVFFGQLRGGVKCPGTAMQDWLSRLLANDGSSGLKITGEDGLASTNFEVSVEGGEFNCRVDEKSKTAGMVSVEEMFVQCFVDMERPVFCGVSLHTSLCRCEGELFVVSEASLPWTSWRTDPVGAASSLGGFLRAVSTTTGLVVRSVLMSGDELEIAGDEMMAILNGLSSAVGESQGIRALFPIVTVN